MSPSSPPDVSSTLAAHCLPRVLFFLFGKQYTGVMQLETSPQAKIYFQQGMPLMAEISESVETVGELLLRTGVVSHEKYHESMHEAAQSGQPQGAVLVRLGAATEEQVDAATKQVVFKRLMRLFRLRDTAFSVFPGNHAYVTTDAHSARTKLHPRRVIYHGIRNAYDLERIRQELGGHLDGRRFRIEPTKINELSQYFFDREDEVVIELLKRGHWTVPTLAKAAGRGELELYMIVFALLVTDLLDLREGTEGVGLSSSTGSTPPEGRGEGSRPPVAQPAKPGERQGTRPGSYRASKPAPEAQPMSRTGLREPTRTFRPGGRAVEPAKPAVDPETAGLINQIKERLEGLAEQNHFQVLGVPATATKEAIKTAYLMLAKTFHPDRLVQHGLEHLRADVERLFSRITEAHSVLSDDARRQQYAATFDKGSKADQEKARKIIDGESAFQRGAVALRAKKFAEAEAAFRQAAELNPEEGEHYAMLGWAMYNNPAHVRAAILETVRQHLFKAMKMGPNNPTPSYYLGEVYLAENDLDRALAQFRRTLELKETHVEAERGVRLAQMRKDKGGDKKGLFDRLRKK